MKPTANGKSDRGKDNKKYGKLGFEYDFVKQIYSRDYGKRRFC